MSKRSIITVKEFLNTIKYWIAVKVDDEIIYDDGYYSDDFLNNLSSDILSLLVDTAVVNVVEFHHFVIEIKSLK